MPENLQAQINGDYEALFYSFFSSPKLKTTFKTVDCHKDSLTEDLIENFDVFIVTGSKSCVNDPEEWIINLIGFVQQVSKLKNKKLLGFCFGCQLIAKALGGKVEKNQKGWAVSHSDINLNAEGKKLFGKDVLILPEMHQDVVVDLPPGAILLANSELSKVEIFTTENSFCIQSHPEFPPIVTSTIIEQRKSTGLFEKSFAENAMENLKRPVDSAVIQKYLLDYISQD